MKVFLPPFYKHELALGNGEGIDNNFEFIGMLSAFMGLLDPGDEVIVFEPYFDQYVYRPIIFLAIGA